VGDQSLQRLANMTSLHDDIKKSPINVRSLESNFRCITNSDHTLVMLRYLSLYYDKISIQHGRNIMILISISIFG